MLGKVEDTSAEWKDSTVMITALIAQTESPHLHGLDRVWDNGVEWRVGGGVVRASLAGLKTLIELSLTCHLDKFLATGI